MRLPLPPIAVQRSLASRLTSLEPAQVEKSRLLADLFKTTDGLAAIGFGNPQPAHLRGSMGPFADVGELSQANFMWSHAFAYTLACGLKEASRCGWSFSLVDVYYDPKSLSQAHRAGLERSLRDLLAPKQAAYAAALRPNWPAEVRLRRVVEVAKARNSEPFTKFQAGVQLPDAVLRQASGKEIPAFVKTFDLRPVFDDVFTAYDSQRRGRGASPSVQQTR